MPLKTKILPVFEAKWIDEVANVSLMGQTVPWGLVLGHGAVVSICK